MGAAVGAYPADGGGIKGISVFGLPPLAAFVKRGVYAAAFVFIAFAVIGRAAFRADDDFVTLVENLSARRAGLSDVIHCITSGKIQTGRKAGSFGRACCFNMIIALFSENANIIWRFHFIFIIFSEFCYCIPAGLYFFE